MPYGSTAKKHAYYRRYYRENKRRLARYQVAYRSKNPDKKYWRDIQRHYGVTQAQWLRTFQKQGRACAACGSRDPGRRGKHPWQTDHDHETGEFRGIICHPCNLALGQVQDSPLRLAQLAAYVARHASQETK